MVEEIIYTPEWGEKVKHAVELMVRVANANNATVKMLFNKIEVRVAPGDDVADVVTTYLDKVAIIERKYMSSEEYKSYVEEVSRMRYEQREKLTKLCKNKPDFTNFESVIDWLTELSKLDMISIEHLPILEMFKKHGFLPHVCIGHMFDMEDRETASRWLIGQALESLRQRRNIYSMFKFNVKQWKDKFKDK
jgi:hypothetical protein